jgi:hypothetical protein
MSPTESMSLRSRWLAAGLLCLPLVFSCLASIGSARVLPALPGPPRPALVFDRYHVNLGEVEPRPLHEVHFIFENHSDKTVKVTDLKPSCGCLTPKVVTLNGKGAYVDCREFAPGQVGVLAMGIRPAKELPGPKDLNVVMQYDDGQPRTETLVFQLVLPQKKLTVIPNELYFYQLSGNGDSRLVEVLDYRDKPAQVTGVTTLASGAQGGPLIDVSATLGDVTTGPDGERRWPIQVACTGDVSSPRQDGWLVIATNDPDTREVRVPLIIFGPKTSR